MDIDSGGADSSPAKVIARSRLFRLLIESPGCMSCVEGNVDEFGCEGEAGGPPPSSMSSSAHSHETLYL